MEAVTVTLGVIAVAALGLLFYQLSQRGQQSSQETQSLKENLATLQQELQRVHFEQRQEFQQQFTSIQDQLFKGLSTAQQTTQSAHKNSQDLLSQQHTVTSKLIEDITSKLTHLERTNTQVLDYSAQLQDLQNILKNPKQRGVLGEYWLHTLLGNILPPGSFALQHNLGRLDDGGPEYIVDAMLFVNHLMIPIDAKFTLENYNRMVGESDPVRRLQLEKDFKNDVKARIDETAKYVQPHRGTTDFAFMFVPAEGVYYNLINAEIGSGVNSQNLVEYAFKSKVMIVAPMSFYAYLQTVVFGLNQLHIEEQASQIKKHVEELRRHLHSYADNVRKLGNYLGLAVSTFNKSTGELKKIDKDMQRITLGKATESETIEFESDQELIRMQAGVADE